MHETTKMIPKLIFLEEQKHLKSVPALSEPLIPKTAIVRKNNIVMYKQNRYVMPKGTYEPGKSVRIEADDANVRFYDIENNTLIQEHILASGIGKCIRDNHPERDKHSKLQQHEILTDLDSLAEKYVEELWKRLPRYVRDQLCIIKKLKQEYTIYELNEAINYCIQRNLYSANYLKDTLVYLHQKKDIPEVSKVNIPLKYSVVKA